MISASAEVLKGRRSNHGCVDSEVSGVKGIRVVMEARGSGSVVVKVGSVIVTPAQSGQSTIHKTSRVVIGLRVVHSCLLIGPPGSLSLEMGSVTLVV